MIDQSEADADEENAHMEDVNSVQEIVQKETGKKIRFLYKFARGISLSSFGVQVADMAGIDKKVIERAKGISSSFNSNIEVLKKRAKALSLS